MGKKSEYDIKDVRKKLSRLVKRELQKEFGGDPTILVQNVKHTRGQTPFGNTSTTATVKALFPSSFNYKEVGSFAEAVSPDLKDFGVALIKLNSYDSQAGDFTLEMVFQVDVETFMKHAPYRWGFSRDGREVEVDV